MVAVHEITADARDDTEQQSQLQDIFIMQTAMEELFTRRGPHAEGLDGEDPPQISEADGHHGLVLFRGHQLFLQPILLKGVGDSFVAFI